MLTIPDLKWADTVESVVGREGLPPIVDVSNLNALRQQLDDTFAASADERAGNDEQPEQPLEELSAPSPDRVELSKMQAAESELEKVEQTSSETLPTGPEVTPTVKVQPTVQKPEAHRLRFKAERQVAQFLHEAGLAQKVMGDESFHLKIENEPYLPLVIEAHGAGGDRQLYLTHYREQNGDLIHDGEMVFGIKERGHLRFRETAVQNALTGGEMRGYDRVFADLFSKNILEQGFAIEAAKQQLSEVQVEQPEESVVLPTVSSELDIAQPEAKALEQPSEVAEDTNVMMPKQLVEKAQKAAKYIENGELSDRLGAVLSKQAPEQSDIQIPASLQAQVQTTLGLARNKQQTEFATAILPMAQQLLKNAASAGLTRSSQTERGKVTAFEGKNYAIRCRQSGEKQELKVLCHKTNGLIYAVDGSPQKSQGLLKSDKAAFEKYAGLTPTQLRQAAKGKSTAVKAGMEQ